MITFRIERGSTPDAYVLGIAALNKWHADNPPTLHDEWRRVTKVDPTAELNRLSKKIMETEEEVVRRQDEIRHLRNRED